MKKYAIAISISIIVGLIIWPVIFSQIWGYFDVNLPGEWGVVVFSKALQPFLMVVLARPRRDMIRIWPLPVVDPWFEDWWKRICKMGYS